MGPNGGWGGGVCHLRGANIDQPSDKWVVCFRVENVQASVEKTIASGGKLVTRIRDAGPGSHYAVLEDPQGGHVAIIDFPKDPLES